VSTGKARGPHRSAGTPAPKDLRAKASTGLLSAAELRELKRWRETQAPIWLRREGKKR
jgi:hypothetical protein